MPYLINNHVIVLGEVQALFYFETSRTAAIEVVLRHRNVHREITINNKAEFYDLLEALNKYHSPTIMVRGEEV